MEMKKHLVAPALAAAAVVARASEGAPDMAMEGVRPLLYLLGGVAALGVVIWGMVKFLGRK
jgi:hypothetical protein